MNLNKVLHNRYAIKTQFLKDEKVVLVTAPSINKNKILFMLFYKLLSK